MALIEKWLPPSRENWEFVVWLWQFFPLITIPQWFESGQSWYAFGKTSTHSRFNLPGKIAWITMEVPGPLTLLYVMSTLPAKIGLASLPWENKVLGALYVIHYIYRAILYPIIAPSMSPMHAFVWCFAIFFQVSNGISIGSWLGGYGPTTQADWQNHEANYLSTGRFELGMILFFLGFIGNIYHDDVLREIRRASLRRQKKSVNGTNKGVDKEYMIPESGLFRWVLYPHYLCEWIEWAGFWLMAGSGCVPARNFVINEIATMTARAVHGRQWYVDRFGADKVGGKTAVIPGVL